MMFSDEAELYVNVVSTQIKDKVIKHTKNLSNEQFAEKLGILPVAARMMRECNSIWPIDTAIKTAYDFGLDVSVDIKTNAIISNIG